ncbi:hypothetical protein IWX49DRAFT_106764 [Phyllosticta citricarpa]|uniref:Uncharacterized protein n=1 Tax=Phyllosticta paracitricarpa TaxID=2016321 RepID=A0ABR1NJ25_9PEZI
MRGSWKLERKGRWIRRGREGGRLCVGGWLGRQAGWWRECKWRWKMCEWICERQSIRYLLRHSSLQFFSLLSPFLLPHPRSSSSSSSSSSSINTPLSSDAPLPVAVSDAHGSQPGRQEGSIRNFLTALACHAFAFARLAFAGWAGLGGDASDSCMHACGDGWVKDRIGARESGRGRVRTISSTHLSGL